MENTALLNQIKVVVGARGVAAEAKKARHDAQVVWEEANASLFQAEAVASGSSAGAEARLRDMTIEAYHQTHNKQPAPGLGIRETTKLTYDTAEALKWATEHKIALALDKKAFEGIVKTSPLDFVSTSFEVTATIAKELEVNALG